MNEKPTPINVSQEAASQFQLEQGVEQTKRNMPLILEYITLQAKQRRAKYRALVKEGFTPEQALELCKGPLIQ